MKQFVSLSLATFLFFVLAVADMFYTRQLLAGALCIATVLLVLAYLFAWRSDVPEQDGEDAW